MRFSRLVIPGIPHHITQRGNRKQTTFFDEKDYIVYKECLWHACKQYEVKILGYCLMSNHVHLIVVPSTEKSLSKAMGRGHESYSRYINFKMNWHGLFWQSRFSSYPMDQKHLYHCFKYVELNPVMAGIVRKPEDYRWSSARSHLGIDKDYFIEDSELKNFTNNWAQYLANGQDEQIVKLIDLHRRSGRPAGADDFLSELENKTGRQIKLKKPGPKRANSFGPDVRPQIAKI